MPNSNEGISTKVGVKGDKEYKSAIQEISRQLTVLNTDMKASQSAFGAQADSMDGMRDRLEKLNEIYDVQARKVELIREQLEKAKAEYGENSKQADDLQIALNRATAQMNNTGNQIKATEGDLGKLKDAQAALGDEVITGNTTLKEAEAAMKAMAKETSAAAEATGEGAEAAGEMGDAAEAGAEAAGEMGDAVESGAEAAGKMSEAAEGASGGLGGLAEALGTAGQAVAGGFLAGVGAVLDALGSIGEACVDALGEAFGLAQDAGKYADDLVTLSTQIGVDTDSLQQWQYASNFIDTSVDTITGSMTKLTKAMGEAQDGNEATQEKFRQLGVSYRDASGNLRDSEDVFMDAIDALGKIQNPAERDAAAMELFGKSAKELNPLIEAGSKAWKEMGKEAEAMGTVFSEDNLAIMGAFDDSMQRFKATGEAFKNTIGLVMIPAFKPLVDAAGTSMGKVAKALQDGASPEEMERLMDEVLNSIMGALENVELLVEDALPVVAEVAERLIGHLADLMPGLSQTLLRGAMGLLQAVLDGVVKNVGPLASLATELVKSVAGFLGDNLPEIAETGMTLLGALADGLLDALPELIPVAIEMAVKIGEGLIQGIPRLAAKLPEVVSAIWDGLKDTDWAGLGGEVLGKVMEGLSGFGEKVKEIFTGGRDEAIKVDWDGVKDDLKDVGAQLINLAPKVLSAGLEGAYGIIEGLNWHALGETIGHIASGLLGLAGEVIAAPLEAGYGIIKGLQWDELGETIGHIASGLLGLAGEVIAAPFEAGYGFIKGLQWDELGETLAAVPNGLINLSDKALSKAFETGIDTIEKLNWSGLSDVLTAVPNGLISLSSETLSGAFTAAYKVIDDIPWDELGNEIADGLGRAWGIVSGVGDVALGISEAGVAAGQQGVAALKSWIASWGDDGEVQNEAAAVGTQVVTDLGSGVSNAVPDLETTAETAANALLDAIRGVLTETTVQQIGQQLDDDIEKGVVLGEDDLLVIVEALAGDAYDAVENAVELADFAEIGRQMDNGIVSGIYENSRYIEEAARAAANAAYAAAKAELGIASPSRKGGWLGEMFDLGFAGGLRENVDEIESAMAFLNDVAAAEAEPVVVGGGGYARQQPFFDMEAMRGIISEAVSEAIEQTGAGQNVIAMDGQIVGETVEPYSSRATRMRQQRSVKGRMSRLVMA